MHNISQDKLDTLQEEKKVMDQLVADPQLQHAFSDATIEKLEEQIKEYASNDVKYS